MTSRAQILPFALSLPAMLAALGCGPPPAGGAPGVGSQGSVSAEPLGAGTAVQPTYPAAPEAPEQIPAEMPGQSPAGASVDLPEETPGQAIGQPTRPLPAADPQPSGPGGRLAGMLEAHNQFRAQHCAPPLSWSSKLADDAQEWADTLRDKGCLFGHDNRTRDGENLAFFRPVGDVDAAGVAAAWYGEVEDYDFENPGFSMETGHFTQVVWTATNKLGCGVVTCGEGETWVCRYNPSGNYRGQYREHVLPRDCQ